MIEDRVRKIVIAGIFSAVVIVLGLTGLGFILLPLGAITILQVPVIIGAILEGPLVGIFIGLLFGIFSIIQAAMIGTTPVDLAFLNHPWIAIVPRILIGPAAWFVYSLISGKPLRGGSGKGEGSGSNGEDPRGPAGEGTAPAGSAGKSGALGRETAATALGAITGSLVNTLLVLSALALTLPDITWPVVAGLASLNGTVEAGFSAAIALGLILPWKGLSRRNRSKLTAQGDRAG
ncbi:MAG: ECF transporter S component [Spirochaetaceae bacterium]|jgi:uncharacterized membrane protein|nr:ECF transporter S component [Spirochaetaceae bacterium]